MHPKLARLEAYLDDGFDVEGIESDGSGITVTLHRGEITVLLEFTREDALGILRWDPGLHHGLLARTRPGRSRWHR